MASLTTLEDLQTELQNAIAMRNTIMTYGQEYMINRRRMVRPALNVVNETINQLEQKIAEMQNAESGTASTYGSRLFARFGKI